MQELPEAIAADRVERLCYIHEDIIKAPVLHSAFFLQLPNSKCFVDSNTLGSVAALAFHLKTLGPVSDFIVIVNVLIQSGITLKYRKALPILCKLVMPIKQLFILYPPQNFLNSAKHMSNIHVMK